MEVRISDPQFCTPTDRDWASPGNATVSALDAPLAVPCLFLTGTALQIADLVTSARATAGQWEMNPFLSAFEESLPANLALAACKAGCGLVLVALYVAWKRIRMDGGFAIALGLVVLVYAQTVIGNLIGEN